MKSVMIVYNQVMSREVEQMLDELDVRGFTRWTDVEGRGSTTGKPHLGTHTWPALNGAILCVIDDERVEALLDGVRSLDESGRVDRGIRAFVWHVEQMV